MRVPSLGFLGSVFISSVFFVSTVPVALASHDDETRDVRLGIVQGDVRLSRGNHNRADLKQPWEEALPNENISQGFALATGNGRASVDFEDGSTIYIAENSLLLFNDLSTNQNGPATTVSLISGSATFELKPQPHNRFYINTPVDHLFVDKSEDFFSRVDAFLDATALTPQSAKGETFNRSYATPIHLVRGQTLLLREGYVLDPSEFEPPHNQTLTVASCVASLQSEGFFEPSDRSLRALWSDHCLLTTRGAYGFTLRNVGEFAKPAAAETTPRAASPVAPDWDPWVGDRVQTKTTLMTIALKASRLSAPIPELTELYQHGTFFECAPFGTCWEPEESETVQQGAAPQSAQNPSSSASNQTFPATVEIYEPHYGLCGLDGWFPRPHVANTPAELTRLLVLQQEAERERSRHSTFLNPACFEHAYIFHHNRYVRLVNRPGRPVCGPHDRCKKHPPFPHSVTAVRVNGKLGLVPRHPDDKKGKLPINLKNGILFLPEKPGQPIHRVAVDLSQKVKVESRIPAELQRELTPRAPAAPAPEIHAHLMNELFRGPTLLSASSTAPAPRITFDYKSQKFLMSPTSSGEKNEKPVAVAGLSGNKISSFAGSYSSRSGGGVDRSGNDSGRGSGYSGGGHYSGSASGGSHSAGSGSSGSSHSYGGGSNGANSGGGSGGSSHYSGGGSSSTGSSSSGSSSSGSSSSSSSGGGRPH